LTTIAIVGSRSIENREAVEHLLEEHLDDTVERIITTGAKGAESFAEDWARELSIPVSHIPHFDFGIKTPRLRRDILAANADTLVAFLDTTHHISRIDKHVRAFSRAGKISLVLHVKP
jgi:hypothetical protein